MKGRGWEGGGEKREGERERGRGTGPGEGEGGSSHPLNKPCTCLGIFQLGDPRADIPIPSWGAGPEQRSTSGIWNQAPPPAGSQPSISQPVLRSDPSYSRKRVGLNCQSHNNLPRCSTVQVIPSDHRQRCPPEGKAGGRAAVTAKVDGRQRWGLRAPHSWGSGGVGSPALEASCCPPPPISTLRKSRRSVLGAPPRKQFPDASPEGPCHPPTPPGCPSWGFTSPACSLQGRAPLLCGQMQTQSRVKPFARAGEPCPQVKNAESWALPLTPCIRTRQDPGICA